MILQKETNTKGIWGTLAKHHIDKLLVNKIFLTRVSFNNVIFLLDLKSFFNFSIFFMSKVASMGHTIKFEWPCYIIKIMAKV